MRLDARSTKLTQKCRGSRHGSLLIGPLDGRPSQIPKGVEIRIQSTNAAKALNKMAEEGMITPTERTLKIAEIKAIRDHLLAAKPDVVGNAVIKTADVMEQKYQAVSKDFDEAIFDHLDNAAEKYPKTMEAVGQSALAAAGGAAIVGLGYGLVAAPAATVVVVGSGVISQKAFEAMGLSPEAAAYYTAIVVAGAGGNRTRVRKSSTVSSTYLVWPIGFNL